MPVTGSDTRVIKLWGRSNGRDEPFTPEEI